MQLAGFTTQAGFLVNCGITGILSRTPPDDALHYLPQSNLANRLLSPAEMGDLFKVIAFSSDFDHPLLGFARGNRQHML